MKRGVTDEEKVKCQGLKQPFCFSAGTIWGGPVRFGIFSSVRSFC